jgi:hypothetical protein
MDKIYQVRADMQAREDYWPRSTHRTLEGATAAITALAVEYGLEMKAPEPDELPCTTGDELFVHAEDLED